MTGVHIGDIGELKIRDVQQLCKLDAVCRRLVQHDDELGIGQHGPRCVRLQQVIHVLSDAGTVCAVLSDTLPELEQELGGIFMHEQQIDLVDEDEGLSAFHTVRRDPVDDGIQDDQHTYGPELLAELQDVVADQAVVGIHIRLLGEGVQGSSGEQLQLQCQGLGLRFRLLQELVPEVCQCRRRALVIALLIEAVDVLRTAVYDGLLPFLEVMPCDNLLAKALQELGFLDDRICLAIIPAHIHGIDVVRRGR